MPSPNPPPEAAAILDAAASISIATEATRRPSMSLEDYEVALQNERQRYAELQNASQQEIDRLSKRNAELERENKNLRMGLQGAATATTKSLKKRKAKKQSPGKSKTELPIKKRKKQEKNKAAAANNNNNSKPLTLHDIKWNTKFEELKQFHEKHGHSNVGYSHGEEYKELRKWVSRQRDEHKRLREGRETGLTAHRVQLLTQLDFVWFAAKTPLLAWEDRFAQLMAFKAVTGHTRVPQKHPKPPGLGNWVLEQRKHYRHLHSEKGNKVLTKERVEKMDAIGFEWSLRKGPQQEQEQQQKKDAPISDMNDHSNKEHPTTATSQIV